MFGSVRVIIMAVVFIGISGVGIYVMKLRSDNAILQANQIQLELSIEYNGVSASAMLPNN